MVKLTLVLFQCRLTAILQVYQIVQLCESMPLNQIILHNYEPVLWSSCVHLHVVCTFSMKSMRMKGRWVMMVKRKVR